MPAQLDTKAGALIEGTRARDGTRSIQWFKTFETSMIDGAWKKWRNALKPHVKIYFSVVNEQGLSNAAPVDRRRVNMGNRSPSGVRPSRERVDRYQPEGAVTRPTQREALAQPPEHTSEAFSDSTEIRSSNYKNEHEESNEKRNMQRK